MNDVIIELAGILLVSVVLYTLIYLGDTALGHWDDE